MNGFIIDGVVDLTRTAGDYYTEDTRTAESLLAKVLTACDAEDRSAAPTWCFRRLDL